MSSRLKTTVAAVTEYTMPRQATTHSRSELNKIKFLEVEEGHVPLCPIADNAAAFNPAADPGFGKEFVRESGGGSSPIGVQGLCPA